MTGEQLEATSYDKHNTETECELCGASINTEQDCYGVSMDGENHCCSDCMEGCVKIGSHGGYGWNKDKWMADASLGNVEVCINNQPDRQTALKEAFGLAEINWEGTPAYIEEG